MRNPIGFAKRYRSSAPPFPGPSGSDGPLPPHPKPEGSPITNRIILPVMDDLTVVGKDVHGNDIKKRNGDIMNDSEWKPYHHQVMRRLQLLPAHPSEEEDMEVRNFISSEHCVIIKAHFAI